MNSISYSPDGLLLATGGEDSKVRITCTIYYIYLYNYTHILYMHITMHNIDTCSIHIYYVHIYSYIQLNAYILYTIHHIYTLYTSMPTHYIQLYIDSIYKHTNLLFLYTILGQVMVGYIRLLCDHIFCTYCTCYRGQVYW